MKVSLGRYDRSLQSIGRALGVRYILSGEVAQRGHVAVADFDAFLVGSQVEHALYFQTGFGGRRADQLDDGDAVGERLALASFA